MAHRTRLAPPPGSSPHITTKLVGSTNDVRRLLAQGWTIVEANGEAVIDTPHNGASVDVPPNISERIEQVLGEAPKKRGPQPGTKYRPRIVRPATAILALFLAISSMAQDPFTNDNYDPKELYTLQYPIAEHMHPDGYLVAIIVVKARSTGHLYRVAMPSTEYKGLKPGDVVTVEPSKP